MTENQRKKYHSLVIPLLLSESDNLEFVELNGLLPAHIFQFFWTRLNNDERLEVIHYYFLDFYRYLLYHQDGNTLIHAILDVWSPSVESMEYFKLLRLAADTNNLALFVLLWKRKLAVLSYEAIGHLMWVRLFDFLGSNLSLCSLCCVSHFCVLLSTKTNAVNLVLILSYVCIYYLAFSNSRQIII